MLALRKWRALRYKNCARSQTAGVSKRSRRRSTKVNLFDITCLAVYLEQQMSSILSHHEDLPSILMMRIITRSLTAAGPPGSRLDFLILESGKLTRNGPCALVVQIGSRLRHKSASPTMRQGGSRNTGPGNRNDREPHRHGNSTFQTKWRSLRAACCFPAKKARPQKSPPRAELSTRRFLGTEGILFTAFKSQAGRTTTQSSSLFSHWPAAVTVRLRVDVAVSVP
jgi:hypothetical protein